VFLSLIISGFTVIIYKILAVVLYMGLRIKKEELTLDSFRQDVCIDPPVDHALTNDKDEMQNNSNKIDPSTPSIEKIKESMV